MNFRSAFQVAGNILLLILVIALVYVNIAHYVFGHVIIAVVKGHSMLPTLHEGDVVIILPFKDVSVGDVIVFKNDRDEYVIHRVIAIVTCEDGSKIYITKGDNNNYVDSIVFGIASRISRTCIAHNITVFNGFDSYVYQAYQNNFARGIPEERIIGKVLMFSDMVIRITGMPSLGLNLQNR
uniref:Signal peptidase I n=1 Tax=Ignisphaera aggregans TaxID=334771 RepID=A0A7C2ZQG4_9CREN